MGYGPQGHKSVGHELGMNNNKNSKMVTAEPVKRAALLEHGRVQLDDLKAGSCPLPRSSGQRACVRPWRRVVMEVLLVPSRIRVLLLLTDSRPWKSRLTP